MSESEHFDDLLSGVIESAASAARPPGADAARKRGRQRRNHQRLAASALSLALLGGVGGIAAVSLHGNSTVPSAKSAGIATASDSSSAAASPSPKPSPSRTLAATPSTTTGTPGTPTSSRPNSASAPNPGTYVAQAWLSPSQAPFALADTTIWDPTVAEGTHLGGNIYIYMLTPLSTDCSLDLGMGGGLGRGLNSGLTGSQYQIYTAANAKKIRSDGTIPASVYQYALFYPSAARARDAMSGLSADYAACKNEISTTDPTTGVVNVGSVQETVAHSSEQCWSLLALPAHDANPGTIDHMCFVQSGSMIEALDVSTNEVRSFSTVDYGATDSTLIPQLQQDLRDYSGNGG